MTRQMKEGWVYLWLKKEWPAFVELEDKRGEHRLYVPEQRIADLKKLVRDMHRNMCDYSTVCEKCCNNGKPCNLFAERMNALGIGDAE